MTIAGVSHHLSELLQDLQVESEEEAESQRATELNLPTRSRRREIQLLQEDLVGPAQGLIVPGPVDFGVSFQSVTPKTLLTGNTDSPGPDLRAGSGGVNGGRCHPTEVDTDVLNLSGSL